MPSAYDLYTFFLEPDHLKGRSVTVHVEGVQPEEVYNPRIKREELRLVMRFHAKKLGLCLNKTQTASMIDITGTDDYSKWPGHSVTLTPSRIDRDRQTITITPAASQPPSVSTETPAGSEPPAEIPAE